jgi:hypothetical protein
MLERVDLFGKGISLKFKGQEVVRSKFGGLLSLILMVFMLFYGGYTFVIMVQRT